MAGDRQELQLRAGRDQAAELRWSEAMARTPAGFAAFCAYFVWVDRDEAPGERVPLRWNELQRRFCARRRGWDIVLKARRVGFSTLEYARDVWFALSRPSVAVGIVVPPHKENLPRRKVLKTLREMVDDIGRPIGAQWNGQAVTFANRSSITVLDAGGSEGSAQKLGRGDAYHRLHIAELAHYPYAVSVLDALLPTVPPASRGGELTVESTARGVGGAFYDHWNAALAGTSGLTPHFYQWWWMPKYRVGTDDGPADPRDTMEREVVTAARAVRVNLTESQLAWWRQQCSAMQLRKVMQEYPHDARRCFLMAGESYFDSGAVERVDMRALQRKHLTVRALDALSELESPAQPYVARLAVFARTTARGGGESLRVWEPPAPGGAYMLAVDCAGGGSSGDWLVAVVLRRRPITIREATGVVRRIWRHEATLRARVPVAEFARWVERLARAYGNALVCVERNEHGGTVLHVLEHELEYPHLWRDHRNKVGWLTGPHNRTPAIDDLADALMQDELVTYDLELARELRTFIRSKTGKVEADKGCNDDIVMAMAIGNAVAVGPRTPERGMRTGIVAQAAP